MGFTNKDNYCLSVSSISKNVFCSGGGITPPSLIAYKATMFPEKQERFHSRETTPENFYEELGHLTKSTEGPIYCFLSTGELWQVVVGGQQRFDYPLYLLGHDDKKQIVGLLKKFRENIAANNGL